MVRNGWLLTLTLDSSLDLLSGSEWPKVGSFRIKPSSTWRNEKSSGAFWLAPRHGGTRFFFPLSRDQSDQVKRSYFVYIITNYLNSVLYIGVTNNLERRIAEHKKGIEVSSFSKKYRLYKLIWFQEFASIDEAIAAEKKMKGWRREKKLNLIKEVNPKFLDLSGTLR